MQGDRPRAVLIEHGDAAELRLDEQEDDQRRGIDGHAWVMRGARQASQPIRRTSLEDHAGEQAVHPLEHHPVVGVTGTLRDLARAHPRP